MAGFKQISPLKPQASCRIHNLIPPYVIAPDVSQRGICSSTRLFGASIIFVACRSLSKHHYSYSSVPLIVRYLTYFTVPGRCIIILRYLPPSLVYDLTSRLLVAMLHDIYTFDITCISRLQFSGDGNTTNKGVTNNTTTCIQDKQITVHLRSFHAPDHSPLSLPDNPHQPFRFHRADDLLELACVHADAALVRELLDRVGPTDTARRGGSRRAKEAEDLLLHVLAQLALLLTGAGVEQAHVDLARGRVERGRADGVAHEAVGLLHVAQLDGGREAHARVRFREANHRLELPRRRRDALFGRARVVAYAAELEVRLDELVRRFFGYRRVDARAPVVDVGGYLV